MWNIPSYSPMSTINVDSGRKPDRYLSSKIRREIATNLNRLEHIARAKTVEAEDAGKPADYFRQETDELIEQQIQLVGFAEWERISESYSPDSLTM